MFSIAVDYPTFDEEVAIVTRTTNAGSEGINSRIQWIKKMACGFRNRERFRNAIYFHLGGLDLYPRLSNVTHTNS